MVPARPMTPRIIGQPGFPLATLKTFFTTLSGLGHSGHGPQWRLRCRSGPIIIDLHHLRLVPVGVANHHPELLVTWLPPMGTRYHTSFHPLNHPWSFGPIAHVDPPPRCIVE